MAPLGQARTGRHVPRLLPHAGGSLSTPGGRDDAKARPGRGPRGEIRQPGERPEMALQAIEITRFAPGNGARRRAAFRDLALLRLVPFPRLGVDRPRRRRNVAIRPENPLQHIEITQFHPGNGTRLRAAFRDPRLLRAVPSAHRRGSTPAARGASLRPEMSSQRIENPQLAPRNALRAGAPPLDRIRPPAPWRSWGSRRVALARSGKTASLARAKVSPT